LLQGTSEYIQTLSCYLLRIGQCILLYRHACSPVIFLLKNTVLCSSVGTGVHFPRVEHIEAQVDMVVVMMIAMKAAMEVETITEMDMGGKENMVTGMMTDMVALEIHPIVMEIDIPGTLMNVIEKMNTKVVIATMSMLMDQVVGAMVERGIHMGMMRLIHLGLFYF
jgi:hypothetical protein